MYRQNPETGRMLQMQSHTGLSRQEYAPCCYAVIVRRVFVVVWPFFLLHAEVPHLSQRLAVTHFPG